MKPTSLLLICVICVICGQDSPAADIKRISGSGADAPEAVRVTRGDLVHTRLLSGLAAGSKDFGFADLVNQLNAIARAHKTNLANVAKLNLYLSGDGPALRQAITTGIKKTWAAPAPPPRTIIP